MQKITYFFVIAIIYNTMYYINIFTYKGDEAIVGLAANSAKKIFGDDCKVFVIDDEKKPISEFYIDKLKKDNINYRTSNFDRKFNLNGKECCEGMIKELMKSSDGDSDGITIKLDSDTLILKERYFEFFKNRKTLKYMGLHRPGSIFSGICYCIKNDMFPKMLKMLNSIDLNYETAPEDMVIGCIATLCSFPDEIYIIQNYSINKHDGDACAWNYQNQNNKICFEHYYNHFDIVTVGNWYMHSDLVSTDRIAPMKGIFDCIK